MEPNCCPYCRKVLTDEEVKRMYKRYCVSQRKDRHVVAAAKPSDARKPALPAQKAGITLDYDHPDW